MMTMNRLLLASVLVLSATLFIEAFVSPMRMAKMPVYRSTALSAKEEKEKGGIFGAVSNFFEELDAFVDDASMRRLGAGASFYGKRKSSFYGENDQMRKADRDKFDPTEDYRINAGGNYKLMEDEDGVLRPVTRRKNLILDNLGKINKE